MSENNAKAVAEAEGCRAVFIISVKTDGSFGLSIFERPVGGHKYHEIGEEVVNLWKKYAKAPSSSELAAAQES